MQPGGRGCSKTVKILQFILVCLYLSSSTAFCTFEGGAEPTAIKHFSFTLFRRRRRVGPAAEAREGDSQIREEEAAAAAGNKWRHFSGHFLLHLFLRRCCV